MKLHSASKSSLFLLELLFSILFFILTAALCIQVFVKARLLSQDAENLTFSHNLCENISTLIRGSDGSLQDASDALCRFYPEAVCEDSFVFLYYDRGWEPADREDAVYIVTVSLSREEQFLLAQIGISDAQGQEIYTLPASFHIPRQLADESYEEVI